MVPDPGVLGVFSEVDAVLCALRRLRGEGCRILTVFSPIHFSEIQECMGCKRSGVRFFTLLGGILGGVGLVGLAVYAHLRYELITGGKPVIPSVPFVVPFFEGMVLFAVLCTTFAWVLTGRLPRTRLHPAYDPRFSEDRFGIFVSCPESDRQRILGILEEAGAEEVRDVSG